MSGWQDSVATDEGVTTESRMIDPVSAMTGEPVLPIVGLGAGTHAKSVVEAIRTGGRFDVIALVDDDPSRVGSGLLGITVEGPEAFERVRGQGVTHAFAGVGGVGSSSARKRAFERLRAEGFELPPIVHKAATVSSHARVGPGCQILAGALVNADTELNEDVIVNTGAVVEHDCRIGAHVHIGPGALIAGLVRVGDDSHIGIGAVVIQTIEIGRGALVAAGAVVVENVPPEARVAGVPARPMAGPSSD